MGSLVTLYVGGPQNLITSGSVSYSRKGVYSYVFAYGNNKKIETTLAESSAALTGNLVLDENWDTSVAWDSALAKTQFTKYQDHYRRFSVTAADPKLAEVDVLRVISSTPSSPRGYREFHATLVQLSTDNTELSPYGAVKDGSWVKASAKGLLVDIDNDSNVPSILFTADVDTKNITKDMSKSVTISIVSAGKLYREGFEEGSNIDSDYVPFLVVTKDRFISQRAEESYRDTPSGSATSTQGADNSTELNQYAENQENTFNKIMTSGSVQLYGNSSTEVGDIINEIEVYYNGAYVNKPTELLVASRRYSFETDTTSIGFSRP